MAELLPCSQLIYVSDSHHTLTWCGDITLVY